MRATLLLPAPDGHRFAPDLVVTLQRPAVVRGPRGGIIGRVVGAQGTQDGDLEVEVELDPAHGLDAALLDGVTIRLP